jgi:hypothetical protein
VKKTIEIMKNIIKIIEIDDIHKDCCNDNCKNLKSDRNIRRCSLYNARLFKSMIPSIYMRYEQCIRDTNANN